MTALAAGHRPCFECRRANARRFAELHAHGTRAGDLDALVHPLRLAGPRDAPSGPLPDGAMVAVDATAYAFKKGHYLRWSPFGYVAAVPAHEMPPFKLLTPQPFLGIVAAGYSPVWHQSADRLIEGH